MKRVKRYLTRLVAIAIILVGMTSISASAATTEVQNFAIADEMDLGLTRAFTTISFNVSSSDGFEESKYGKFDASKSTITFNFNGCTTGSAKVIIHTVAYNGPEVYNFVIPKGPIPMQYVYLSATIGATYYITIEPYGGYIQAIGSFGIDY